MIRTAAVVVALAAALAPAAASALPIGTLPGFLGIRVFEQTTSVTSYAIGPAAAIARRAGLGAGDFDFTGTPTEYYDVFASDAAGAVDPLGEYVSIEVRFDSAGGGGGNITAVDLVRSGLPDLRADVLASFASFGPGAAPASAGNAVDGNAGAGFNTTLGSTFNSQDLLRVTVGWSQFISAPTPEGAVPLPAPAALLAGALALLAAGRRRRAHAHARG